MSVAFPCSPPGSFGNSRSPLDAQPSCCLHLRAVLAQTVMPSLESTFCNSHPVVSSSLFICLSMICFALSVIFGPFPFLACESESLFVRIVSETSRPRLTWLCALPQSNGGKFPHDSSTNADNIGSSPSDSLRTPS